MAKGRASAHFSIEAQDNTSRALKSAQSGFKRLNDSAGRLNPTVSKFSAGLGNASSSLLRVNGVVGTAALGFGAFTAATVAAVEGTRRFVTANADLVAEQGRLASKIGASVGYVQAYRAETAKLGISTEQADDMLKEFSNRMGDASFGTGVAADAIKAMGLDIDDLLKLQPDEMFYRVKDALDGVANESQRVFLSEELFGGEGHRLIGLTAEGIKNTRAEMQELGLELNELDVAGMSQLSESTKDFSSKVNIAKQKLASDLVPAFSLLQEKAVGAFSSMVAEGSLFRDAMGVVNNILIAGSGVVQSWGFTFGTAVDTAVLGTTALVSALADVAALTGLESAVNFAENVGGYEEKAFNRLDERRQEFERIMGNGGFIKNAFLESAKIQAEIEKRAEASAKQLDENAKNRANGRKDEARKNLGLEDESLAEENKLQADLERRFDILASSLRSETQVIEDEYAERERLLNEYSNKFSLDQATDEQLRKAIISEYQAKLTENTESIFNELNSVQLPNTSSNDNLTAVERIEQEALEERTALLSAFQEKSTLIQELSEQSILVAQQRHTLEQQLEQEHQSELSRIAQREDEKKLDLKKQHNQKLKGVFENGLSVLAGASEKGRKVQELWTKGSMLMDGLKAAQSIFASTVAMGGPFALPAAYAAAGTVIATTLASVAKVGSAKEGNPVSSSYGGGSSGGAGAISPQQSIENTNTRAGNVFNINVISADEIIDQEKFKHKAAQAVAEATDDSTLLLNNNSAVYNVA